MPQSAVTYAYDADNRPSSLTRSNGVKTDYSFDPVGQLLSIVHSRGTSSVLSLGYSYDATGQRISQQSTAAQPLVTEATTANVDDANRLVQRGATSFSYDANGNLASETGSTGTTAYTWDARNRLSRVVTPNGQATDFTYDFAGNLIRQSDAGPLSNLSRSYTLDVLTNVAFEQSSDGDQFSVLTAPAIDTHLATHRPNGEVDYALVDAMNSTVATVDQTGAPKGRFDYDPFGRTAGTGSVFPFAYTGRVRTSSGLYNYRARFYSETAGRFISEDPIGVGSGDANLYRYALNQPLLLRDPLGLRSSVSTGVGFSGVGFDVDVSDETPHGEPAWPRPPGWRKVSIPEQIADDFMPSVPSIVLEIRAKAGGPVGMACEIAGHWGWTLLRRLYKGGYVEYWEHTGPFEFYFPKLDKWSTDKYWTTSKPGK
jgi:RHS repeat-associated protein